MKQRAVLVDVSIDQGGCFETSRPTTHTDPTYEVDGITHYCVANMPGAVPITSTQALTNATLPYVLRLADQGAAAALAADPGFAAGLSTSPPASSPTRPSPPTRAASSPSRPRPSPPPRPPELAQPRSTKPAPHHARSTLTGAIGG